MRRSATATGRGPAAPTASPPSSGPFPALDRPSPSGNAGSPGGPGDVDDYYATVAAFLDRSLQDRGDGPWWRELAERLAPGRIVELGCGTGRVTRWLAGDGRRVVGVDRAPAMLARARSRLRGTPDVHLVRGDLRTLPLRRLPSLRRPVGLVAGPGDPFVHLTGGDERQAALDGAARLLEATGRLVLEIMWWTPERADAARTGDGLVKERTLRGRDGTSLTVRERWRLHADGHTVDARYTYRVSHDASPSADPVEASFRGRRWTLLELHERLARAGLETVSLQGGWDGRPFDPADADVLLVEARPVPDPGRSP